MSGILSGTPEASRPTNNFNALRLIAASLVLFDHGWGLQGHAEPLDAYTGYSLGNCCVLVFFAISGFLITQSLDRRPIVDFIFARGLRIFPGLAACVALTTVALSALTVLPLDAYFSDPKTMRFIVGNASLMDMQFTLPGVFTGNRLPYANGSLWSLPYELFCYGLFALALGWTDRAEILRKAILTALAIVAIGVFLAYALLPDNTFPREVPCAAQLWFRLSGRRRGGFDRFGPNGRHVAAAFILMLATREQAIKFIAESTFLAVATLWLAHKPDPVLRRLTGLPDISYGIYIYAYPVQQVVSHFAPDLHPLLAIPLSFLLVAGIAALSWRFVEKPALGIKRHHLRFSRAPRAAPEPA